MLVKGIAKLEFNRPVRGEYRRELAGISSTSLSIKSMTSISGDIRRRCVGRGVGDASDNSSTSMTSIESRRRRWGTMGGGDIGSIGGWATMVVIA